MSEEELQRGAHEESYERQDLSVTGVFYFMLGLVLVIVLVYGIVAGMYRFLEASDKKREAPMNPMAIKTGVDPRSMTFPEVRGKVEATFPKPVLERSEQIQASEFGQQLREQDKVLASYDWVDQKNGVVRIPIDRAMELLAQRGLPVRPEGGAGETSSPAGKAKAAVKGTTSGH
jgi:hypothetical protein